MCFCSHLNPRSTFVLESVSGLFRLRDLISKQLSLKHINQEAASSSSISVCFFFNSCFETWHLVKIVQWEIEEASIGEGFGIWSYSWGSQLLYCKHHWPNPYCTWESLACFVFFFIIFKMVLLITRNQNLILLNNRQSCMSVLRGKMHTISLLVYARWCMPFFSARASYDLAWKVKVTKTLK